MSEQNNQHGKREAPGGEFPLVLWWRQHREWVAGLDRGAKIKYRIFQALVVVAILIIALTLFLRSWMRLPEIPDLPDIDPVIPDDTSQVQPDDTGDISFDGATLPDVIKSGRKDGYYTFLLSGVDVVSNSTDTMILITYDTKNQSINAVSLLRDTMINISAKRGAQKRLNTVYTRNLGSSKLSDKERVENGMNALKLEVSKLTGIYPDFHVLVKWEAIGRLVDAIGGVYFDVPFDMNYDDPYQNLHIHQAKGYRLLDGQDAMEVIRFRKSNKSDPNGVQLGDVGRTQIQRDFLTAVLKKCLTPEILLKLPSLVQIFTENVDTDLTVGNILAFAQLAVGMDAENNVTFTSMPYYGVMYDGASLVCVQEKAMLELLNSGVNPYQDDIKSSDLQLMYKKSGGGFGVTNAALADSAVAQVPVVTRPEDPDDNNGNGDDNPGGTTEPGTTDNPGDTTYPGSTGDPGGTTDPGTAGDPGGTADPGAAADPGDASDPGGASDPDGTDIPPNIGAINPSEIFPEPYSGTQGGPEEAQTAA